MPCHNKQFDRVMNYIWWGVKNSMIANVSNPDRFTSYRTDRGLIVFWAVNGTIYDLRAVDGIMEIRCKVNLRDTTWYRDSDSKNDADNLTVARTQFEAKYLTDPNKKNKILQVDSFKPDSVKIVKALQEQVKDLWLAQNTMNRLLSKKVF